MSFDSLDLLVSNRLLDLEAEESDRSESAVASATSLLHVGVVDNSAGVDDDALSTASGPTVSVRPTVRARSLPDFMFPSPSCTGVPGCACDPSECRKKSTAHTLNYFASFSAGHAAWRRSVQGERVRSACVV